MSQEDHDPARRVDRHVGARLRLRRKRLGRSQARVGQVIGVSFQQVQKYERGANQLSAAKLWALAEALDAPIGYFFEGLEPDGAPRTDVRPGEDALTQVFWSGPDAGEWVCALAMLDNARLRRRLLSLVQALIGEA